MHAAPPPSAPPSLDESMRSMEPEAARSLAETLARQGRMEQACALAEARADPSLCLLAASWPRKSTFANPPQTTTPAELARMGAIAGSYLGRQAWMDPPALLARSETWTCGRELIAELFSSWGAEPFLEAADGFLGPAVFDEGHAVFLAPALFAVPNLLPFLLARPGSLAPGAIRRETSCGAPMAPWLVGLCELRGPGRSELLARALDAVLALGVDAPALLAERHLLPKPIAGEPRGWRDALSAAIAMDDARCCEIILARAPNLDLEASASQALAHLLRMARLASRHHGDISEAALAVERGRALCERLALGRSTAQASPGEREKPRL